MRTMSRAVAAVAFVASAALPTTASSQTTPAATPAPVTFMPVYGYSMPLAKPSIGFGIGGAICPQGQAFYLKSAMVVVSQPSGGAVAGPFTFTAVVNQAIPNGGASGYIPFAGNGVGVHTFTLPFPVQSGGVMFAKAAGSFAANITIIEEGHCAAPMPFATTTQF